MTYVARFDRAKKIVNFSRVDRRQAITLQLIKLLDFLSANILCSIIALNVMCNEVHFVLLCYLL